MPGQTKTKPMQKSEASVAYALTTERHLTGERGGLVFTMSSKTQPGGRRHQGGGAEAPGGRGTTAVALPLIIETACVSGCVAPACFPCRHFTLAIEFLPPSFTDGYTPRRRVVKEGGLACMIGPVHPTHPVSRFFADVSDRGPGPGVGGWGLGALCQT